MYTTLLHLQDLKKRYMYIYQNITILDQHCRTNIEKEIYNYLKKVTMWQ